MYHVSAQGVDERMINVIIIRLLLVVNHETSVDPGTKKAQDNEHVIIIYLHTCWGWGWGWGGIDYMGG